MSKRNNEKILLTLMNTTDEFKASFDKLFNHLMPLPEFEDERLELQQKYLAGQIKVLIEHIQRKHQFVGIYHEKIKDYPLGLLNKMLCPEHKEMIFAVGEKERLNSQIEQKVEVYKKTFKM